MSLIYRLKFNFVPSDVDVRIVISLDIEYRRQNSRKSTLSRWPILVFPADGGNELRVTEEVADKVHMKYSIPNTAIPAKR
jgi:hypothetical protein